MKRKFRKCLTLFNFDDKRKFTQLRIKAFRFRINNYNFSKEHS